MNNKIYELNELSALALDIAQNIEIGSVICLTGDLGAGKTTLASEIVKALGSNEEVTSPTFNLVNNYECDKGTIWHFDLYRLEEAEEVEMLGMDDAFNSGISIIEWPDLADSMLPPDVINIKIDFANHGDSRYIRIT